MFRSSLVRLQAIAKNAVNAPRAVAVVPSRFMSKENTETDEQFDARLDNQIT